jgi:excisionase family DNA binding protein
MDGMTTRAAANRNAIEQLLTKDEAAAILKVSVRFVERCVAHRRLRHVRVGRFIRIPMSAVQDYIEAGTVETINVTRSATVRRLIEIR